MEEIIANKETNIKNEENARDDEFWKSHVSDAQNFMGSDPEYCRRNRISLSTFKSYKMKFGLTKPRRRYRKAFLKLDRKDAPRSESINFIHSQKQPLPDAQWLAEFVTVLMARK